MNASLQRILNVSSDKLSQLRGILLLIEVSLLASELVDTNLKWETLVWSQKWYFDQQSWGWRQRQS